MQLDNECRQCLINSQLKKVERLHAEDSAGAELLHKFETEARVLCQSAQKELCAPLLMREIDRLHRAIFGKGIDYSREKSLFNQSFLKLEEGLYGEICASSDPVCEAMKYAMAANYIDFARISTLGGDSINYVIDTARRATPDINVLKNLKKELRGAKNLCYLHDNCGEVVADKLLIRAILKEFPQVKITSVVRGGEIINDVTLRDAREVGLENYARVIANGTDIPGTYLKEISANTKNALDNADVIISKGLGNLETLYGEGYHVYYSFTCKCEHISERFKIPLWSAALIEE